VTAPSEQRQAAGPLRLVALGDPFRRDDGVGVAVARRVRAATRAAVEVVEPGGDPAALLDALAQPTPAAGAGIVMVVDAVRTGTGAPPGSVHRVELEPGHGRLPDLRRRDSSHALGLGEAIELAVALGRLPAGTRLVLFGVEGARFDPGTELSAPVAAAVEPVAAAVLRIAGQAGPQAQATATRAPRRAPGGRSG